MGWRFLARRNGVPAFWIRSVLPLFGLCACSRDAVADWKGCRIMTKPLEYVYCGLGSRGPGVMWWSWKLGVSFPVGLSCSPLTAPDTKEGLFMIVKPNESAQAAKDRLRFEAVTKLSGDPVLASVEEDWVAIPVEASCSAIFSFDIFNWSLLFFSGWFQGIYCL